MTEAATAPTSRPAAAVLGKGLLADALRTAVSRTHRLVPATDPACGAVVTADDAWSPGTTPVRPDLPRLAVRTELGNLVVGPLVLPDQPGCAHCADVRRDRALGPDSPRAALRERFADLLADRATPVLSGWACEVAASLVTADLADPATARTLRAVAVLSLTRMTVDVHPFLPDPSCPHCGGLPPDGPPLLMATPRPKPDPDTYRMRDLAEDWDLLVRTYVDGRTGVIRQLDVRTDYRYPMVSAPVHLPGAEEEAGFGRDLDYAGCARTALAEALERLGGARPGGRRSVVRAAHREVADQAVHPADLGLYPPERYAEPGFPYPPFDPDAELTWVWGHSLGRNAPVLVPEDYAYYRTRHGNPLARPLAYEVSNGCALGGCLEEAALHGLIELAERDAFLLTWYARLPVPRIDLATVADPRIAVLAERIRQDGGHHVMAYATTPDHGIPTAWVMAVHPAPGAEPAAVCAAGAHFDPERAVLNGMLELAANLGWNRSAHRTEHERITRMVADPELVRDMRDHALLYCHPAAFDRFDFLMGDPVGRPVEEAFHRADCRPRGRDLRADLAECVERFTALGLDVVVVDQTTDEHRAGRLACAKVIVPGLLPMTFGHRMRRTHGLPRLLDLPARLGHRPAPLGPADVNPHPHPFP
ncbi:TOMM precursor leader peptide-binding protein [Streptomyces sp. NPDC046197]|uniref:TOMM precursor leader peptide-binding protein n=1 Tax=Streptomyces sp. NPDC046197 TaxID=3154337 RepID=UPI0033C530D2